MPNILLDWLVSITGTPAWFIGGLIGLVVFIGIYVAAIKLIKMRGIMLASVGVFVPVLNFLIFDWPMWASIVAGIAVFYQATNKPAIEVRVQ